MGDFLQTSKDRGAVLISVLLLVMVMSIVAAELIDKTIYNTKRAGNQMTRAQALSYAMGAEALGRQAILRGWQADPDRSTLKDPWAVTDLSFPIEGGQITVSIQDGDNCFNLNSLAGATTEEGTDATGDPQKRFLNLASAAGLSASDALVFMDLVIDWIDGDQSARPYGAEDFHYGGLATPYRTPDGPLAGLAELRALDGIAPESLRALAPFVCVQPTSATPALNINTLRPEQAALLSSLFSGVLDESDVRLALEGRPSQGFASLEAFWGLPLFREVVIEPDVTLSLGEVTRHYRIEAQVSYEGAEVRMTSFVELTESGSIRVLSRQFGEALVW